MRSFIGIVGVIAGLVLSLSCRDASPAPAAAPTKPTPIHRRAVLVGIDDYSASATARPAALVNAGERVCPGLRGAVRDTDLLREMLIHRYGFSPAGILTLKNQEATHDAILQAIERHLAAPASRDDVLLFYFAGHGSQVANSLSSESDHLDESIVPADSRAGAPDIRDKQLAGLFNRILDHHAGLTVIFDSCHSGSISRAWGSDSVDRGIATDMRDVRDPSDPPAPELRGALVLTASKDFARAFEKTDDEGKYHGVFSWALLRAMRNVAPREAAADTYLRAQAIMRGEPPYQDPVIAGNAAIQSVPLFADIGASRASAVTLAVESTEPDGTLVLQGGWTQGLTVGSELRVRGGSNDVVVRITAMRGISRCEGRVIGHPQTRASQRALARGTLLELKEWAALPGRPLRVWIAQTRDADAAAAFASALRDESRRKSVRWIEDPTAATPTHVLRWRNDAWELADSSGKHQRIGARESARAVMARIPAHSALFIQVPAPVALAQAIGVGRGTDYDNVEQLNTPEGADYVLAGRLADSGAEYAWLQSALDESHGVAMPLPARTDWRPLGDVGESGDVLRHWILTLYKVLAWHVLSSPPASPSPYRLVIDGMRGDTLTGGSKYRLLLRNVKPSARWIAPRYYYIFGIDSFGKSVLLFPLRGSVENRFPLEPSELPPARELEVGFVNVTPPYGLDSYFLISSDESLANPAVVEWSGVRTRGPRGSNGLEELLSRTGGSERSSEPVITSPIWSIDRLLVRSVAPGGVSAPETPPPVH